MFYDIVFDLIKIIRSLKASQNDCQILIFVKAIYVVGEKMTRNSHKLAKLKSSIFWIETEYSRNSSPSDLFIMTLVVPAVV